MIGDQALRVAQFVIRVNEAKAVGESLSALASEIERAVYLGDALDPAAARTLGLRLSDLRRAETTLRLGVASLDRMGVREAILSEQGNGS